MYTEDVRVDNALNRAIWVNGIRNVPRRIRIRVTRRRNEDEDAKEMYTEDVRVDNALNRAIWVNGIRNVPRRIRIRVTRRRNEDEDAKEKFYSLVQHLEV